YALAEQIHGSGILAVVVAALMTAHSSASDVRLTGQVQTASVWRQVTFILQALAFFLVGMEIVGTARDLDWPEFWLACALVPICVVAMIVTRMHSSR
ncbi:MAG: cation:proton antiporter, partial [Actinomycetales bacterium]